ncbi:MAG: hypothetical protein WBC73_14905 [Phormidesmis sp.]
MASPTNGTPTSAQNAQAIAALTAALDTVVSQFIRPAMQQANGNRETLDEVIDLLSRHGRAIVDIDERLEAVTNQFASVSESLTAFDQRLEETRALVADNASQIAQLGIKQTNNAEAIAELGIKQTANAEVIAELGVKQTANAEVIAELGVKQATNAEAIAQLRKTQQENAAVTAANGQQVRALVEASQSQLAAVIGNSRRIEQLEQQAS